ncbi:response regulator [Microbacterium marinilacus]|uniref:Response regulator n=1 Tax=Microbacterium marinilacus TaxID=415209 RepID=A0ABP7BUD3_9MICO|nr:response regulator [Microbacterium marinilacus]MBY0689270.1 response regulator [Microbacterium marinilacus]
MSILLVEDDDAIRRTLALNLEARGYDVEEAADGQAAVSAISTREPALVVLDLGLPRLDGVEAIRTVRLAHHMPILVLSGRSQTAEKVAALDAGANDYVTKPFAIDELLARIRALLRAVAPSADGRDAHRVGSTVIDLAAHTATRDGEDVRLTPTEWAMLEVLLRNAGRLVGKRELLTAVWGPTYTGEDAYLRLYMSQLRRKLEPDPARPRHLLTEPGLGYRYRA